MEMDAADTRRRVWRPRRIHEWVGVAVFALSFGFGLLGVFLPVYRDQGIPVVLVENILVGFVSGALLGGAAAAGVWLLGVVIKSTARWSWFALVALVMTSAGVPFVVPNDQTDSLDLGASLGALLFLACLVTAALKASRPNVSRDSKPPGQEIVDEATA